MTSPAPTPRPGDQLASTVSSARVVVIRSADAVGQLIACGGAPMVPASSAQPPAGGADGTDTLIGKRYVDAAGTLELLCTCSGAGRLTYDGVPMTVKAAKPLPASD